MLTGKDLGDAIRDAIREAIRLKKASGSISGTRDVASHFGIKTPSIYDWMKKGSIGKEKLQRLFEYFSDVVGPEHWGIDDSNWLLEGKAIEGEFKRLEDQKIVQLPEPKDALMDELVSIADRLTDRGKIELIGMAKALCSAHNKYNSINVQSSQ